MTPPPIVWVFTRKDGSTETIVHGSTKIVGRDKKGRVIVTEEG